MKDVTDFFAMTRAILQRKYPMPWKTFFLALFCLVYFISPIDLLPDVLPILGITDDATFILLVLSVIKKDINAYRLSSQSPQGKVIDLGDIKDHKKK